MDFYSDYPERLGLNWVLPRLSRLMDTYLIHFNFQSLDFWAQEEDADICLYGHLHVPSAWMEGKTLSSKSWFNQSTTGTIRECLTLVWEIG